MCKQEYGQSVSSYALKIKCYIDNLERLGHLISLNLAVRLILISFSKEYDGFVQNYNMHSIGKIVNDLHAMLKLHEQTLPKKDGALALYAIRAGRIHKNNNKNKKPQKDAKGKNQGNGKLSLLIMEYLIASLVGPAGDPWDQRVRSQLIGKDLVSGLLVYELPLSSLRKKYRLSLKNDMPPRDK
ncbi:hypothetical protein Tco_0378560 [Tanacetum coccineum]